jgi:hypothetical protein
MRKYILLSLVLTTFLAKAQDSTQEPSVEKNLYGLQLGLVSASFQYETKLLRKMTLHTEIGLELGFSTKEYDNPAIKDETSTLIIPYLSVEPRWYYGLDRRLRLGKNIKNNGSNYFSLETAYQASDRPVSNSGNFDVIPSLNVIPKFGIRRNFAKYFNYEFSAGVGYQHNFFSNSTGCSCEQDAVGLDIQTRIGYNF